MRNAGLDEAQTVIKIARRNINNLRYAYDTTLMAESEEELKSLLMKVKDESKKLGLKNKLNIQETKIMASGPIISRQIDGERVEISVRLYFLGSKITVDDDCSHEIKRHFLLGRKAMTYLDRQHIKKKQHSVQFSSVAQLCLTLCDPMNRSMPCLPIHLKLLEFTQTHAHRVSDAITLPTKVCLCFSSSNVWM